MIGNHVRRGRKYQKNRRCNVKKETPGRGRRRSGSYGGGRVRKCGKVRKANQGNTGGKKMNDVRLYGTLTKDPYIRHAESENGYDLARFTIKVEQGVREDGRTGADNINLVAFRKIAELVEKKLKKDMAVLVSGHIHSGSYTDREGNTVFSQSIVADKIDIVTAAGLENTGPEAMQAMPETMGDLPFSETEY